jgi:hypothetical protein
MKGWIFLVIIIFGGRVDRLTITIPRMRSCLDNSSLSDAVCKISGRPIDNVYINSSWSMSNFQNFVYNVE